MLDHKQQRLIESWTRLADQAGTDEYTRFLALWIAFNAYCYAHYAPQAHKERADLRRARDLQGIPTDQQPITGTILRTNNRVKIDLEAPSTIRIVISERYTEDHIFNAFAEQHQDEYKQLLKNEIFQASIQALQEAIQKRPGEHYVVNMAKAGQHRPESNLRDLENRGIIVGFNDHQSLKQLKNVLYQIRCNIFHGEKTPGEPNDDRIVKAATPVLKAILEQALTEDGQRPERSLPESQSK